VSPLTFPLSFSIYGGGVWGYFYDDSDDSGKGGNGRGVMAGAIG
jgi:hypothetical protein